MGVIRVEKNAQWRRYIGDAFKAFQKDTIDKEAQAELELFAQNLIYYAIGQRRKNPNKHDYTGNLLSSIVAAVYKDKELTKAYFSGETGIRAPRYYEMTASHGHYHFTVDYEGKTSNFTPDIETLRRKGLDDAYEFVSTYVPDRSGFVVVVAYTTDYANWVEIQRKTTGFMQTYGHANRIAMRMFELKKAA